MEICNIKSKKKEMHRIEVLDDIEKHETSCLHKSPPGNSDWTNTHRIKTAFIAK